MAVRLTQGRTQQAFFRTLGVCWHCAPAPPLTHCRERLARTPRDVRGLCGSIPQLDTGCRVIITPLLLTRLTHRNLGAGRWNLPVTAGAGGGKRAIGRRGTHHHHHSVKRN